MVPKVVFSPTFHTNTGSNGDLAFFSREYCLECESLEPASPPRALWIAWNRPRAETKEGRRGSLFLTGVGSREGTSSVGSWEKEFSETFSETSLESGSRVS